MKKFTVDCSVNAEESLGRENKGDKLMFIAVLFTINDQE